MTATRSFQPLDVFTCPLDGIRQIEASAGTGKTWNLCGLYLRLLLERRLDVQRILVVTFTNAATAELRERIRQRIVDTLAALRPERGGAAGGDDFVARLLASLRGAHGLADDAMAAQLELALATFDEAAIFTIHGFCQRALADTPFTAQMPLALELVRDDQRWVAEAVHDFWRRRIAAPGLDAGLAGHLVARQDTPGRFAKLLKRHLARPLARAAWPDDPANANTDAASAGADAESLVAAHALARETWHAQRDEIAELLRRALPELNATSYKEDSLATAMSGWDEVLRDADAVAALDALGAKLELLGTQRLAKGTKKNRVTPSHPFFELAQALLALRAAANDGLARRRLALLRELLAEGAHAQREAKRRQRVIAFDDMLFNLHDRLTNGEAPWLAGALKTRFPAALIDEFQDTDPLQFAIFRTIYASGAAEPDHPADADAPLFFVGDPKQAIYSFRNADLHTYLAAGDVAAAHYSLAENQRSTAPLIDALNALFGANPRAFMLDGLDYQPVSFGLKPRTPLVDRSGSPGAALQVWALPDDAASGEPIVKADADRAVVAATAGEIARLLAAAQRGEITLGDAPARPLAAGDIAVLVRSNAQGAVIRQALAALGVGSVELSQASVFLGADADELERVLAAILEPARMPRLKAALATEALGWDAAAIARLDADESLLILTVQRFAAQRETWIARGVGFMLRRWLTEAQVTARLLARADGPRRLTNLLHLIELLHDAARRHPAPDTLLRWLQSQIASPDADDASQLRLESDQNLVQIVTIHKSKGLEYPVVFCPFLWSGARPPRADGLDGMAYHDDDGQAVIDYGHDFRDDAAREDIKRRQKLEESAESLRLVYVALTRAVHRCVLVAGCYRSGRGLQPTTSARSLLNWLVAGDGMTAGDWFEHKLGVPAIRAAWTRLAEVSGGAIDVRPLPDTAPVPFHAPRAAPESLAALPAPASLPAGWRIGSFSAMVHGARHDASGVDHDLRARDERAPADDATPAPSPFRPAADDILNFPRGPAAGEALHQVFERIAFDDPATRAPAIASALRLLRTLGVRPAAGVAALPATAVDALHARMLERLLDDVLATPLPLATARPLRLAGLPNARRLVELEFHLPAHRLDANALNALLEAGGYAMSRLAFAALRGFLKGFIDLVFEHEGRWFVLDWKSNHLGDDPAAYARPALAAAMREQHYHLQSLLYLVALDRLLRRRVPGYAPERHLGGAVYLFVRGVRPGWTDATGAPTGVFFDRPDPAFLRRLSALFDAPEVSA